MTRASLPIDRHLAAIVATAGDRRRLIVSAEPGAGKTTRIPPALVASGMPGTVLVLEPRRLAARAAARRVAAESGVRLGGEVGYHVRHDRRTSAHTRLAFLTEGVLVRRIVSDPELRGVSAVVLDEFHERHLEGDLALAMLREVQETLRPDLSLVVMSATLDVEPLRVFLDGAGVVEVAGQMHPVAVRYTTRPDSRQLEKRVADEVRRALAETSGHVLVFLPGMREIRRAAELLTTLPREFEVLPLHGQLAAEEQDRAVQPSECRKVVLATNIAESSLTIEGVTAVVDSGWARLLRHDQSRGMDVLRTERISRASATQRQGRAGRTGPGICYRLWSAADDRSLAPCDTPEIARSDVAGALLQVRAFAGASADDFGWFEPPGDAALERAETLLGHLGAVDPQGMLTEVGRRMSSLPLHPRLARMMLEAEARDCRGAAAALAALLSERELFRRDDPERPSEVLELWRLFCELENGAGRRFPGVDRAALRSVIRARDQFLGQHRRSGSPLANEDDLVRTLLAGYPDRLARRAAEGVRAAMMVGGRGVELPFEVAAEDGDLFLVLQLDAGGTREGRAVVLLYAAIEREWLEDVFPGAERRQSVVELDEQRSTVIAIQRVCFAGLTLEESRGGVVDPQRAGDLLSAWVARDPWRFISRADGLRTRLARWKWLASQIPSLRLPAADDAAVARVAGSLCAGRVRIGEIRGDDVWATMVAGLDREQHAALRREAPSRVDLPSGRRVAIDYGAAAGPTVAAPLQEFFGVAATPCIGGGRVPLVLHLLAPNRRPVQITADLSSFWQNVYPGVRNELSRRYPRHAWPLDPLAARPQRGPRRRR